MNWDAIAAIGQAVSALALVMVIVQIRYSREEAQRNLGKVSADTASDVLLLGGESVAQRHLNVYEEVKANLNDPAVRYIDNLFAQPR